MKIFISLIMGVLCFTQILAQEHYYYYKGEKIHLELNPDYIFISGTDENNIRNARINIPVDNNNSTEITEDIISQTLYKPVGFVEEHPTRYWQELGLHLSSISYLEAIQQLREDNSDLIVSPYFQNESMDKIGLSNYFYVKLKNQDDFSTLLEQIAIHGVELVGYNKFMPLWFTLSVTPSTSDAMQMANVFYETNLFQYAEPDLMTNVKLNHSQSPSFIPDDTFYPDQWHLNNTGQNGGIAGIDINAEDAWDITLGDEDIAVAVLDHGFEMDHPDLVNNTLGTGYDTDTDSNPSVLWGPHGTACAGIAGAEGNNNEGISGVAPDASLVSISNELILSTTIRQELANGINWAWQNGADVISNSWGSNALVSSLIDDAINNALINGRGGLGTVVVFSSGNNNINGAEYPSNSNPDILCVGAIDRCGIRSGRIDIVPESCDPWCDNCSPGSSFGTPLDVVAGGTNIPTTDRQGDILGCNEDYNPNPCFDDDNYANLDYNNSFGGTSAACPQVAGVAALILSINPNLTAIQVNDIIEQSAQKIRTDNYTYQTTADRPNGTWNNELGYGLVDALQAVLLAQELGCQADMTLSGTINSDIYEVSNTINATGNIGANQSVTFDAGNAIFLNDVFTADASNGSTFLAHIEGCDIEGLVNESSDTDNSIVYTMEDAEERLATDELITLKNYPNPFTGQTTIEFALTSDSPVTLFVSDVTGKQIAVLLNGEPTTKGTHQVTFNAQSYPAGMYYYTIQAGSYVGTQRMILVK